MSGIKNRYFEIQHELLGDGKSVVLINQNQRFRLVKPEVLMVKTRGLIGKTGGTDGSNQRVLLVKPEVLIGQTRGTDWSNQRY
jgi:hypothetical protein